MDQLELADEADRAGDAGECRASPIVIGHASHGLARAEAGEAAQLVVAGVVLDRDDHRESGDVDEQVDDQVEDGRLDTPSRVPTTTPESM